MPPINIGFMVVFSLWQFDRHDPLHHLYSDEDTCCSLRSLQCMAVSMGDHTFKMKEPYSSSTSERCKGNILVYWLITRCVSVDFMYWPWIRLSKSSVFVCMVPCSTRIAIVWNDPSIRSNTKIQLGRSALEQDMPIFTTLACSSCELHFGLYEAGHWFCNTPQTCGRFSLRNRKQVSPFCSESPWCLHRGVR